MEPDFIIGNCQQAVLVAEAWLTTLEHIGPKAIALALATASGSDVPLMHLGTVEVALVDDLTSRRVHEQFMGIAEPTDVISFHHGELVIGVEVAVRQAAEYHEPLLRELLRYIIHGLLHLAGHEDDEALAAKAMLSAQEQIVATLWDEHGLDSLSLR